MLTVTRTGLVACAALLVASCGPTVDLTSALRVNDIATGWTDGGYADGVSKVTPTVSFTLTNTSTATLDALQLNAVFRRIGESSEWSARFTPVAGSAGLAPGRSTRMLVLTSDLGYTGFDAMDELLTNSHFVDADVDLFAKYGSTQWVRLGRFRIDRKLVAVTPS
jgi:hypothetical protein